MAVAATAETGLRSLAQQIGRRAVQAGTTAVLVRRSRGEPIALTRARHEHTLRAALARELPSVLRNTVAGRGQELLGQPQPRIDRAPSHLQHRTHHGTTVAPGPGSGPLERPVRRVTHLRQSLTGLPPTPG
ncbi:hypothetical protein [Pseudonocardia sp. HH130630-07]|uniref:hypothetical protein n=1 Tax=Pseudonocardia sp. HH130630-07 TaxID=1690815 RepID=UPI000814C112|nr:hypothetical protein [Pseudonocardia sp. HH130630-07]ANY05841.1 hypothetical protein AFB00_05470 [Pseudonocardia sp. HH130630-07]ANY06749.1 hypothetical protein AFB00_11105 [Pseudonocardia sp. HH130630-07]